MQDASDEDKLSAGRPRQHADAVHSQPVPTVPSKHPLLQGCSELNK